MDKKGKEILKKLAEVHGKADRIINEQIVSDSICQTALNIKKVFFRGMESYTVETDSCETILANSKGNDWGIYIFTLKLDKEERIEDFKNDWQEFKENSILNVPALKKNKEPYKEMVQGSGEVRYALYIGKSNTLSTRLEQHIQGKDGKGTTYYLRLKNFNNHIKEKEREYVIEVCYLYSNNNNISYILSDLEKSLHREFEPLLGTSR